MIHTVKGFVIVNEAEIDVFLELSCFFDDPMDVGNLTSGSSAFHKSSWNIWKFTVHVFLKPGLEIEHYFASITLLLHPVWETMETVRNFILEASKITTDGNFSHEIKRHLILGKEVMTNLDSILKSRDINFPTNVHLVKGMVFPVVMYGSESFTMKKVECQRIDAFKLWCWRRLLRVLWTARKYSQSILKINAEYSLEGLMLKLKLRYFGHMM